MEMIDRIIAEGATNLATAAKTLTANLRTERPVHPGTVGRWINPGVTTPDGRRIRLEAFQAGRKWMTSRAAITRFLKAQQPEPNETTASGRSPAQRQHDDAAARGELERRGAM